MTTRTSWALLVALLLEISGCGLSHRPSNAEIYRMRGECAKSAEDSQNAFNQPNVVRDSYPRITSRYDVSRNVCFFRITKSGKDGESSALQDGQTGDFLAIAVDDQNSRIGNRSVTKAEAQAFIERQMQRDDGLEAVTK